MSGRAPGIVTYDRFHHSDEAAAVSQSFPISAYPLGGRLKRVADVIIAIVAIVVTLPIMLMLTLFIKLSIGGSAFFAQQRVGFRGRTFRCYKFRTMVPNADAVLAELLRTSPAAATEWRQTQKLRADPRVTRLGKVLRKSSMDELPQLFNILIGDMSCVGPRPITREELQRYGSYAGDYLSARPGLTGLWQVSGRSTLSYARRVALDRYYVRRWSTGLDLAILLRTIPALLSTDETS